MLIQPYHQYKVLVEGSNRLQYLWHLDVFPENKAWRVVNQEINVGSFVKGYHVLSVELFSDQEDMDEDLPISLEEFNFSVSASNIGYAVTPSYAESYRCQICGGIVASNTCTDCMFDWDS